MKQQSVRFMAARAERDSGNRWRFSYWRWRSRGRNFRFRSSQPARGPAHVALANRPEWYLFAPTLPAQGRARLQRRAQLLATEWTLAEAKPRVQGAVCARCCPQHRLPWPSHLLVATPLDYGQILQTIECNQSKFSQMHLKSILGNVLRLLGQLSGSPEELDADNTLNDYYAIVNSCKYADSNTNTEYLDKLLALIGLAKDEDEDKDTGNRDEDGSNRNKVSIDSIICRDSEEVLPGQPAYKPAKFGKVGGTNFALGKFDIPKWIYDSIKSNDTQRLRLAQQMTMDNYVQRFQTLLWVEEAQQTLEMRKYDMYDVMLAKKEDFFLLEIPGLAEGRPSLLRGDRLFVRSDQRASYYEGYIHEVRERDILFKLHEYLHRSQLDGLRFTIQFLSSRTPFRRCHHGVTQYRDQAQVRQMIFPTVQTGNLPAPLIPIKETSEDEFPCFMTNLNQSQRRAVMNVLRAQSRPAPYLMFGPPGTGKTVTMVEAVLQIYARSSEFKILVCANSNASADLCAKRIKDSRVVNLNGIIRVSAFYRMERLIPPELADITRDMDSIDAYMFEGYRVVVTTCIQAGSLCEFKDRFDYVFIDEAGHASEPETLIAMSLLSQGGCCVLIGDPHQLGPICVSRVADQGGLGCSLLERLCRRSLYLRNCMKNNKMDYNEIYITKLQICYRCDPRVLTINNKLFYDGDLKFVAETPKFWLELFKVDSPLIFHACRGRDRREFVDPSWFNPAEAIRCLTYAKRLYESGLRADQLGVITPYRRQIEKLNLLFESCGIPKCKISTMEEFQGDEREVIIISTVRTRAKKLEFDKKFQLGFLFNPKRFNVAISRAKWLCIVIGDPDILRGDLYWSRYMKVAVCFEDDGSRSTENPTDKELTTNFKPPTTHQAFRDVDDKLNGRVE